MRLPRTSTERKNKTDFQSPYVTVIRKTLLNKKHETDKKNIFPSLRSYYESEESEV